MLNPPNMKYYIIILTTLLVSFATDAQTRVVNGRLTAYSSFPVMNVEITSKKAKATTMSDSLGIFSIVCMDKDMIMIKPQAFSPVNKKVSGETDSLIINLVFVDTKKNRELAVNSGYITETNLNYAIANLEEENNDYCKYTDIYALLRAEGSGITVSDNGQIVIRGGNTSFTAGASGALIVVDGQPTTNIEWIRPCIVKSVNILKDSEATIYGTRGGNGVVVITTKH
jgi:TonB-dependent SusC/RagA subfamily outer membrane receptor